MAILANRVKIRHSFIELGKFVIYSLKKTLTIILLTTSFYLLHFSVPKPVSNIILETVGRIQSASSIIYDRAVQCFNWVNNKILYLQDLQAVNLRLKLEIDDLRQAVHTTAELQMENKELKKLLSVIEKSKRFTTAKIVSISSTPFSNRAILQSGSKSHTKVSDIVRGSRGLLGRITEVSDNYSIVILINDCNSRIPVITGVSGAKGILAKEKGGLKVIYLEEDHNISVGEVVYTSGDGQIFPRGIPVAIVTQVNNTTALVEIIEKIEKIGYAIIESVLDYN